VITVRRFHSLLDAQLAHGRLEAHGIHSAIPDLHLASIDPRYASVTGVRLDVAAADAERAQSILDTVEPEDPHADEQSDLLDGPKCPQCSARYSYFERSSRAQIWSWMLLGIPLLFTRPGWHCRKCDHWWRADDEKPRSRVPYRS
jgi:hypothetical protein